MPDLITLLQKDHRALEALFEQYRFEKDPGVVRAICTELAVHAAVEEEVVYPVLGSEVPGGIELQAQAHAEHQAVKEAVAHIRAVGYGSREVDELVQAIVEEVTGHVRVEEGEILPTMKEALGQAILDRLGRQLESARQRHLESAGSDKLIDLTREELYQMAQERGIEGRPDMTRDELIQALRRS